PAQLRTQPRLQHLRQPRRGGDVNLSGDGQYRDTELGVRQILAQPATDPCPSAPLLARHRRVSPGCCTLIAVGLNDSHRTSLTSTLRRGYGNQPRGSHQSRPTNANDQAETSRRLDSSTDMPTV